MGEEVRNFRHKSEDGKVILDVHSSPQFVLGRDGWVVLAWR